MSGADTHRGCQIEYKEAPTAGRGLPVSLSGLALGEEHHQPMIPSEDAFVKSAAEG